MGFALKLKSFKVKNFRNVLDSTDVPVDTNITTLVGTNESGKSAMLDALYRLNPAYPGDKFDSLDDYPRWRRKRDGRQQDLGQVTPIEATFELDDSDVNALESAFGFNLLSDNLVRFGRRYNGEFYAEVSLDEPKSIRHVLDGHPDEKELLASKGTLDELQAELSSRLLGESDDDPDMEMDNEDLKSSAPSAISYKRLETLMGTDLTTKVIDVLKPRMPVFFRFAEYQKLEGRVSIDSLRSTGNEMPGSSAKQTARALLQLADTDIDSLTDTEFELRTAELEAVSSDLSQEMSEYWSTNPDLRIKVDIEQETIEEYRRSKSVARYINFRVEDRKHDFTNNFERRSSGYQWFFSFMAAFSEFEQRNENVVILLDEPALTLHAKAQKDFLRFIEERLAPVGQVIYTTHSPFMVEKIERVRVVEDRGGKEGSVTSAQMLEVGADSIFPLQAALGYDLSQNLFVGTKNLLVEGPSDLIFLDVISRFLRDKGRESLDESWRILPAGGSSNVPAFVSLLGRKISVTVLLDSGTEGVGKVEAAIRANKIDSGRVVFVGSVLDQKHCDIEDLFTPSDYLKLYNGAFGTAHKVADLPKHPDRLVLKIQQLDGKFDHWRPAEFLLRNPAKIKQFSVKTLDNFERLGRAINATER